MRLLLLLPLLLLSGCNPFKEPSKPIATDLKVVRVTVPPKLLEPCIPPRPSSKEDHLKLSMSGREAALAKHVIALYGTVNDCNVKLNSIKELQKETKE